MTSSSTQPQIVQQTIKPNQNQNISSSSLSRYLQKLSPKQVEDKFFGDRPRTPENVFFDIMDQVDQYDHLLKQMNDLYTEGMLTIANVKFINPYSSLSTKGYKPTPAIIKVSIASQQRQNGRQAQDDPVGQKVIQNQPILSLITQTRNIQFTHSVIDSINSRNERTTRHNYLDQANLQNQVESQVESHSAHSSQSTANQLYSYEEEELIIEEEETIEECRKLVGVDKLSQEDFILSRFNIQSQREIVIQGMNKFNLLLKKLIQIAHKQYQSHKKFDSLLAKNFQKPKQTTDTQ